VPEENFWTLWCKGRLTEADTPTIRLGATPSGLTSAHLHQPPSHFFTGRMPFLPVKALKAKPEKHKMLDLNRCTKTEPKPKPTLILKNCSYVHAYHCTQLPYTTRHRTVLMISLISSNLHSTDGDYWREREYWLHDMMAWGVHGCWMCIVTVPCSVWSPGSQLLSDEYVFHRSGVHVSSDAARVSVHRGGPAGQKSSKFLYRCWRQVSWMDFHAVWLSCFSLDLKADHVLLVWKWYMYVLIFQCIAVYNLCNNNNNGSK